jgi:hypothetical protein
VSNQGLSFHDTEALLVRLGETATRIVVVGGQAVNFWASYYEDRVAELKAAGPFTSKDVDVCAGSRDLETMAQRLGGTARMAGFDDHPPQVGTITFVDGQGTTRVIDVMTALTGLKSKDVHDTSVLIDYTTDVGVQLAFRVMHPVLVLESRAHNVLASAKYQTSHGIGQLRASVHCAREFLKDLSAKDPKKTLKWNERVFRFRIGDVGKQIATTYGIDSFDAIACGPELPQLFHDRRYPQMQAIVGALYQAKP